MSHTGNEHRREDPSSDDATFVTPDMEEFLEENSTADDLDGDDRPLVPEGVLRGIEDIEEGRTASVEDIEAVLDS